MGTSRTLGLDVRPDIETRLRELAEARGESLDAFLLRVVEEGGSATGAPPLSTDEWFRQFEEWADSFPDAPAIPDAALTRESLYPDRG
jgi:hypothetical protein